MKPEKLLTLDEWLETQVWISSMGPWYRWASKGTHQVSNEGWRQTDEEWNESLTDWLLD